MRVALILFWLAVLLPLCGSLFVPDYFAQGIVQILFTLSLYAISAVSYLKARDRVRKLVPQTRLEAAIINQQLRILSSFCGNIALFLVIGAILSPVLKDILEHNMPGVDVSYILTMLSLSFVFQFLSMNVITHYKDEDGVEEAAENRDAADGRS